MRRIGLVSWLLLAGAAVVGCTPGPAAGWQPGPITTLPPASQSLDASPSGPATPASPSVPTIPDSDGALDASGYESAHFASPSGRIWCALYPEWTLCHFPRDMDLSEVPSTQEVCPEAELDVTGVSVGVEDADYFCSGGAEALPQTNGDYVGWWRDSGFPAVKYDGQRFATLPYGEKLRRGRFVCLSERSGVTCGNTQTGAGFKISRAGVVIIK